ncbi:MAG: hypothetical protein JWL76_2135 [Thermoleophilia bacterium]|nr:hypothetical protein [Thermoleophilia bacterium]
MAKSNHFNELAAKLPARADALLDAYQAHFLDAAMQLAPYDEGELRDSGTMSDGGGKYERQISFTAAHALPQEFGTLDMPAQPYVRPAERALRAPFRKDAKGLLKP